MSKTFGTNRALRSFSLALVPGEIHALLGQNGSGKSTLIKVLSGYHYPDPGGRVAIGAEELPFGDARAAYRLGLRFVHQDLGLVDDATVADNLAFTTGWPTRFGTIRGGAAAARALAMLDAIGLQVDPDTQVRDLTAVEKTGVAVARALQEDADAAPRVLVLDEPTARLPADGVSRLLRILKSTAAQGVALIYVTHHVDEVFRIADGVSVLRDGAVVTSAATSALDREQLVRALVGSDLAAVQQSQEPSTQVVAGATPALAVDSLAVGPVNGMSLALDEGEVVGIYGVTGSGSDLIVGAIFGARPRTAGAVLAGRVSVPPGRPDRAISAGVGYLPADRRASGGMMELTARENLLVIRPGDFWRGLRLSRRAEQAAAREWFARLEVRPPDGIEAPLDSFSGGNQQKILFGKWLREEPKVLLLDDPTQGVDVGAKVTLHREILAVAEKGSAVLISSTDIEELAALCTRVLIVQNGRITRELRGAQVTADEIKLSLQRQTRTADQVEVSP